MNDLHLIHGKECLLFSGDIKGKGTIILPNVNNNLIKDDISLIGGGKKEFATHSSDIKELKIRHFYPSTLTEQGGTTSNIQLFIVTHQEAYLSVLISGILQYDEQGNFLTMSIDEECVEYKEITEEDYEKHHSGNLDIDWSQIRTKAGFDKADAFEFLCNEIVQKYRAINLEHISKGSDGGRDGQYYWTEEWLPNLRFKKKWMIQAKYSEDIKKSITTTEIYDNIIEILQYRPDYYLLMTNRNMTKKFVDWFENVKDRFLPTKIAYLNRESLEKLIRQNPDIWQKYFL